MPHENMALAKPLDTAPKDHTMIWLLVDYSDEGRNPLEDEILGWTIGFNGEEHTGISQWQFTGWNWQQDCFTEGFGKVVGWYPLTRPNTIPLPTDADLLAEAMKLPEVAALVKVAAFLLWAQDNKALDVRDCTEVWASLRTTLAPFTAAKETKL